MKNVLKKILGSAAIALTISAPVHASIVFDDSVAGKITVTWDETFTVTAASNQLNAEYMFLVAKDLFATSDGPSWAFDSMTQSVSINGGAASLVGNWFGWQYRGGPEYNYDQQDLILGLTTASLPSFNAGDVFEWSGSQTVSVTGTDRMPDLLPGSSTTAYLANYTGTYSNIVTTTVGTPVPEPESIALFGIALAGLGLTRRKAKRA